MLWFPSLIHTTLPRLPPFYTRSFITRSPSNVIAGPFSSSLARPANGKLGPCSKISTWPYSPSPSAKDTTTTHPNPTSRIFLPHKKLLQSRRNSQAPHYFCKSLLLFCIRFLSPSESSQTNSRTGNTKTHLLLIYNPRAYQGATTIMNGEMPPDPPRGPPHDEEEERKSSCKSLAFHFVRVWIGRSKVHLYEQFWHA